MKYNVHVHIYIKKQNNCKTFLYAKSHTLFKTQDNFRKTIYVTQFFLKFLKLEFIYKNHDTLRYVTFLYTKSETLGKKQDNLRYVFIYKNSDTLHYAIFHGMFEIWGGGGIFYMQKKCTLRYIFICKNKFTLSYVFIHKKPETLRYIFIRKKQCTFHYVLYLKFII